MDARGKGIIGGGLVLALVVLFLPLNASADVITVECGNSFKGLGGGSDFLTITEGFEELSSAPQPIVQAEMANASDACRSKSIVRVVIAAVLIGGAVVFALYGPWRRKPSPPPTAAAGEE